MFGFRTGKLWKKILSVVYLSIWGFVFVVNIVAGRENDISTQDYLLEKVQSFITHIIFVTPYIFLSETKLREKLPLFRDRKKGKSVLGLFIVIVILLLVGSFLEAFYSDDYLGIHEHEFEIVDKVEVTCDADGVIKYTCVLCDEVKSETIPSVGHELKEIYKTEATCDVDGVLIKKCIRCDYEEEVVLTSQHNMVEISKVEATEKNDGNVLMECSICKKQETEVIKRIGGEYKDSCVIVNYEDISRNPDNYIGENVVFKGEVIQIQESEAAPYIHNVIRMNVTQGNYGIWNDTIYVEYMRNKEEIRILEDDIITVYGELQGIKTYTAVLGNSISIPHLVAKYVEIN